MKATHSRAHVFDSFFFFFLRGHKVEQAGKGMYLRVRGGDERKLSTLCEILEALIKMRKRLGDLSLMLYLQSAMVLLKCVRGQLKWVNM